MSKLNEGLLLLEAQTIESEIFKEALSSPESSYLHRLSQHLTVFKKLAALEGTPEEFYQFNRDKIKPSYRPFAIQVFLNRQLDKLSLPNRPLGYRGVLEPAEKLIETFYSTALKRDFIFVKKIFTDLSFPSPFPLPASGSAVLITGGFHTAHLKTLLKSKNIPYVVITPAIAHETNKKRYEKFLLGDLNFSQPKTLFSSQSLVSIRPIVERNSPPTLLRLRGEFNKLPAIYPVAAARLGREAGSGDDRGGILRSTLLTLAFLFLPAFAQVLFPSYSPIHSVLAQEPPPVEQNNKDVDTLIKRLTESTDPADKIDAANRLGSLKDRRVVLNLRKRLLKEDRPDVKEAIIMALGKIGDASAVREIMSTICDKKCNRTLESRGKIAINMMDSDEVIPQLELAIRGNFWAIPDSIRNNPAEFQKYEFANNQAASKALSIARVSNSEDLKRHLGPSYMIAVEHKNTPVRRDAINNLTELKDPQYSAPVLGKINDNDAEVKDEVEKFFKTLGESAVPELLKAWEAYQNTEPKDKFEDILTYVVNFVSTTAKDPAVQKGSAAGLLRIVLATENPETQKKAVETLLKFTQELSSPSLPEILKSGAGSSDFTKFLKSDSPQIRSIGITAISQVRTEESVVTLLPFLDDPDPQVRQTTKEALTQIGLPHPGIKDALTHKNYEVRQAARDILRSLKVYGFWEWFWFSLTSYLWQIITSIILSIASGFGITKTKWYKHRQFTKHQGKRHQAYLSFLERTGKLKPDARFIEALKEGKRFGEYRDYVLVRTFSDLIVYLFPNEKSLFPEYPNDTDLTIPAFDPKSSLSPKLVPTLLSILEAKVVIPTLFYTRDVKYTKDFRKIKDGVVVPFEDDRSFYFRLKAAEILIRLIQREEVRSKRGELLQRLEQTLISLLVDELESDQKQKLIKEESQRTRAYEYNALNTAVTLSELRTPRAVFYSRIQQIDSRFRAQEVAKDVAEEFANPEVNYKFTLQFLGEALKHESLVLNLRSLLFFNALLGREDVEDGKTIVVPRVFSQERTNTINQAAKPILEPANRLLKERAIIRSAKAISKQIENFLKSINTAPKNQEDPEELAKIRLEIIQLGRVLLDYLNTFLKEPDTTPKNLEELIKIRSEIMEPASMLSSPLERFLKTLEHKTPGDLNGSEREVIRAVETLLKPVGAILQTKDASMFEEASVSSFLIEAFKASQLGLRVVPAVPGTARTILATGATAKTIRATVVGSTASQAPIPMKPRADGRTIADAPKVKVDPKGPTIPDIPTTPQAQGTIIVTKPIEQILIVGLNPNQEIIYKMGFRTQKLPNPIFKKTPKEASEYLKSEEGKAVGLVVLLQDHNTDLQARRQAFAQYLKNTFNLPTFFIDSDSITENPGLVLSQLKAITQQATASLIAHPSSRSTVAARLARRAPARQRSSGGGSGDDRGGILRSTLLTLAFLFLPAFAQVLFPSHSPIHPVLAQEPPPVEQNNKDVDTLIKRLTESTDPADKIDAANRLGSMGDRRVVPDLRKRLLKEDRPDVKEAITMALGKIGDASAVREIMSTICDKKCNNTLKSRGIIAINMMNSDEVTPYLDLALRGKFWAVPDSVRNNPVELQKYEFANNQAASQALTIAQVSKNQALRRRLGPSFAIAVEHENLTIRREAIYNLAELKDPQYTAPVLGKINDNDEEVKEAVEKFFKTLGESAIPELLKAWEAYQGTEPKDKFEAILSYVVTFVSSTAKDPQIQKASSPGLLKVALATENPETQKKAIETLLKFTQELSSPTLAELLKSGAGNVERDAGSSDFTKFLKSDSSQIRLIGITAISQVKTKDSVETLLPFLDDPDPQVRQTTKEGLIQIALPHPGIKDALTHKNYEVRQASRDILRSLKVYGFWEWFWFSLTSYLWQIVASIVLTIASGFGITKTKWYKHRQFTKHQGKRHQAYLSFLERTGKLKPDARFIEALKEGKRFGEYRDYVLNRTLSDLITYLFPNEKSLFPEYPNDTDLTIPVFNPEKDKLDPRLIPALLNLVEGKIRISTLFYVDGTKYYEETVKVTLPEGHYPFINKKEEPYVTEYEHRINFRRIIKPGVLVPFRESDERISDKNLFFRLKASEILIKLAGMTRVNFTQRLENILIDLFLYELEQDKKVNPNKNDLNPNRTHDYNALNIAYTLYELHTPRAVFYSRIQQLGGYFSLKDVAKDAAEDAGEEFPNPNLSYLTSLKLCSEALGHNNPVIHLRALWFFNALLGTEVDKSGKTVVVLKDFKESLEQEIIKAAQKALEPVKALLQSKDTKVLQQAKIALFLINQLTKPRAPQPGLGAGTTLRSGDTAKTIIATGPTAKTLKGTLVGTPNPPLPLKPRPDGLTIADAPKPDPRAVTVPEHKGPPPSGTIVVTKAIKKVLVLVSDNNQKVFYSTLFKTQNLPQAVFKTTPGDAFKYLSTDEGKEIGLVVFVAQDSDREGSEEFKTYIREEFKIPTLILGPDEITENPNKVISELKAIIGQSPKAPQTPAPPKPVKPTKPGPQDKTTVAARLSNFSSSKATNRAIFFERAPKGRVEKFSTRPPFGGLARTRSLRRSLEQESGGAVKNLGKGLSETRVAQMHLLNANPELSSQPFWSPKNASLLASWARQVHFGAKGPLSKGLTYLIRIPFEAFFDRETGTLISTDLSQAVELLSRTAEEKDFRGRVLIEISRTERPATSRGINSKRIADSGAGQKIQAILKNITVASGNNRVELQLNSNPWNAVDTTIKLSGISLGLAAATLPKAHDYDKFLGLLPQPLRANVRPFGVETPKPGEVQSALGLFIVGTLFTKIGAFSFPPEILPFILHRKIGALRILLVRPQPLTAQIAARFALSRVYSISA